MFQFGSRYILLHQLAAWSTPVGRQAPLLDRGQQPHKGVLSGTATYPGEVSQQTPVPPVPLVGATVRPPKPRPAARVLQSAGSALGRFGALLLVAVLAGSLLAAIMLPVVGGTGLAARTASEDFINLPTTLPNDPLPTRSTILAADGTVLASYYYQDRLVVPISKISPLIQHAIVSIEDARFYEHTGIDLRGAMRALVTNSHSGGVQEGASTLTMQLVRNLLVSNADTEEAKQAALDRTLARKIREMRYALGMEAKYSKAQILEAYLNIAYFGAGAYGVEAAARRYFSISASQLTLPQAATLAGIVQQPVRFDPLTNPTSSQRRRNIVLSRMADLKYITAAQATAAQAVPMLKTLRPREVANGCSTSFAPMCP